MDRDPAPVSVVIPSKGRPHELSSLLQSIAGQTAEVLVMLDGMDYPTKRYLERRFPTVRVFMSEQSVGPLYHRNRGADIATNEIIVFLDDDIVVQSAETIRKTAALFDADDVGAVTIPFFNTGEDQHIHSMAPTSTGTYYTSTFYAGMVAFRRNVFLRCGGYREIFFYYFEEPDLAFRMMNEGFFIRLGTGNPMLHAHSPRRNSEKVEFLGARNNVLCTFLNAPWPYLVGHLPMTIINRLRHGVNKRNFGVNLKGVLVGILDSVRHFHERSPVACNVYELCRAIRAE